MTQKIEEYETKKIKRITITPYGVFINEKFITKTELKLMIQNINKTKKGTEKEIMENGNIVFSLIC